MRMCINESRSPSRAAANERDERRSGSTATHGDRCRSTLKRKGLPSIPTVLSHFSHDRSALLRKSSGTKTDVAPLRPTPASARTTERSPPSLDQRTSERRSPACSPTSPDLRVIRFPSDTASRGSYPRAMVFLVLRPCSASDFGRSNAVRTEDEQASYCDECGCDVQHWDDPDDLGDEPGDSRAGEAE